MDFGILGPLEILGEDRGVALGGTKQRALLALLLLHANETLSTDRLIDSLWGNEPPASAAKTVQVHVSRLRKTLATAHMEGSAELVTRESGYELRLEPERIDARRFERLVADGRTELAGNRPERAASALQTALSLWRGEPLADLAYEPFAQREIARLADLRIAAIEELIDAQIALGQHADVVGRLDGLIDEHPFRERLRAQLMLALYRSDRQADALQAYQDARRALVDELGIEPGERLRELEQAILNQDPALGLRPADEPEPESRAGLLVGRDRELRVLMDAFGDAYSGRGRLALVGGEPGIGKSRLVEELIAQARARGADVLVGRCWEAGGAPAYWPWVQALRAYVRQADAGALRAGLGDSAAELAHVLPELRGLLPGLSEPPVDGSARFRLFEAVTALLALASRDRPVVLALDDLHAADEPSLLLLRFVAREIGTHRLLVVGAYRDVDPTLSEPLSAALAEIVREPHTDHLVLAGLSERDVAEYVEVATGADPPASLVHALHEETEGNPLFVAEVVRLLVAERRVGDPGAHLTIPPSVRAVISRRVARLSQRCRELLVLASVIGREFAIDALARVSDLGQNELLDALDEAMTERVVVDMPGAAGRLRFGHALMRDTLYDDLTPARRLRLHRAIGEALEQVYARDIDPHVAELAQHFVLAAPAGTADRAVDYARRAGDRAARQLAFEEAARYYQTALGLGIDDATRCDLLLALGEAQARAGDTPASKDAFRSAAELAERSGFGERLARAALGYGGRFAWTRASTDPELVPLLERALAAVGDDHGRLRVRLLGRLGAALRDDPVRDRRVRLAEEGLDIATRSGDPTTLAYAMEGYFIAVEGPGAVEELHGLGEWLLSLTEQIGDREMTFAARDHRLNTLWTSADRAGVDTEIAALAALANELRQPAQRWGFGTMRVMLALMEGRFADAERLIAETLAVGERAQSWNARVSERLETFVLRRAQGRLDEVEDTIARSVHEYPALLRFRCALAHLYDELGRMADARALVAELLSRDLGNEYLDAEWLFSLTLLADPCAAAGSPGAAERLYALLAPYAHLYAEAPVEATFGSVARALGVLAGATGRFDDAERHFLGAIEVERRMRARPWLAHAQHGYGELLAKRGESDRARPLLDQARATYAELGMDTWVERVV